MSRDNGHSSRREVPYRCRLSKHVRALITRVLLSALPESNEVHANLLFQMCDPDRCRWM